ncbi:MAG: PAAR domain-containing protein [Myxococcales bacterium]|nr:PAAR domain-containing protein [Myxococcales bacterium]
MTKPLAKQDDDVVAVDTHIVLIPSPSGPVPTPLPNPFRGPLSGGLSSTVFADEKAAATVDSTAQNASPHVPQGGSFQNPPKNEAKIIQGSGTVFIDDKAAARLGDPADTCNDPSDLPIGKVIASGTVLAGD